MIETVDTADSSAVRNKNNVLALYDLSSVPTLISTARLSS